MTFSHGTDKKNRQAPDGACRFLELVDGFDPPTC